MPEGFTGIPLVQKPGSVGPDSQVRVGKKVFEVGFQVFRIDTLQGIRRGEGDPGIVVGTE